MNFTEEETDTLDPTAFFLSDLSTYSLSVPILGVLSVPNWNLNMNTHFFLSFFCLHQEGIWILNKTTFSANKSEMAALCTLWIYRETGRAGASKAIRRGQRGTYRPREIIMPSLNYIQYLNYQKAAKHCAMEREYAIIIEGMVYRAPLKKGICMEGRLDKVNFSLKNQ